ncbi:hypothetical protein GCM10011351_26130 [Paraliobacillus quinghaiensis]|uniref:Response regulator n=1 Tax=Paraliobacillus quinghaiensis TaxID=470815 RepID=A0A917WXD1_9BACI|nr:response regulator [Paraliobacillus quinghaiensis]GGM38779.1 hypothetical protein GCM10011351_26130 [Paraliobacillus quinghaiensis]
MCNVIIVDDEPVIRFGLKASINWEAEGLTLLGDFPNGEEAIKAMSENPVDILITDIKMPIMDGLTLMKEALKIFPNLKVILVSSYNDFEYVQEGLRYGAIDYVLKPTLEPDEFLQLIKKCVKKIREERDINTKLHLVDQTKLLQERKQLEQKLKKMLLQGKDHPYLDHKEAWMSGSLLVVYAKIDDIDDVEERFGDLYSSFALEEIHERFYSEFFEGVCLVIGETEILFLLKEVMSPEQEINQLKKSILEDFDLNFSFGYHVIRDLKDINNGVKCSRIAYKKRFFHPEQDVFKYDLPNEHNYNRLKAEQLKQFLLPFDEKKVKNFIEDRYEQWNKEEMDPDEIQQEATDILTNLFYDKLDLTLLLAKCSELNKTETLDGLFSLLVKQIDECSTLINDQDDKPYVDNGLMEEALEYIHQYYTEMLTLQMVADHIHISRNYFSILFKRYSDKNFIDYVIDLRIKKAAELLMNTSLKVYEVAKKSGFNDVKYFSKLFKKMTGHSPGDYRAEHQK